MIILTSCRIKMKHFASLFFLKAQESIIFCLKIILFKDVRVVGIIHPPPITRKLFNLLQKNPTTMNLYWYLSPFLIPNINSVRLWYFFKAVSRRNCIVLVQMFPFYLLSIGLTSANNAALIQVLIQSNIQIFSTIKN